MRKAAVPLPRILMRAQGGPRCHAQSDARLKCPCTCRRHAPSSMDWLDAWGDTNTRGLSRMLPCAGRYMH